MNTEQKYENNTLPEIIAELRHGDRQRSGAPVYNLLQPTDDLTTPSKVLLQSLGDIADRLERADNAKTTEIREILAKMREDLEESSWPEEYPIIDEDGERDDCCDWVVRKSDVLGWMRKIESALTTV